MKDKRYRLASVLFIVISALFLSGISFNALGAEASDSNGLFDLSLEQLMDVGVYAPSSLTEKDMRKTPASVTVITSKDIAVTPARNILDLIEIYVPGAMFLNHSVGPLLGIRGFLTDRQYKYLINVNGINQNLKPMFGAKLELSNWELSDIDRIEIIRGPGSVIYGPGAIGGVINIFTKRGKQAPGVEIGGQYFGKYDSRGNYISYGKSKDQFDLYTYFSFTQTDGVSPDLFSVGSDTAKRTGYMGEAGGPYSTPTATGKYGVPPNRYLSDWANEPQIKAHLDIQFNDNWRFWGRYVTESTDNISTNMTQNFIEGKYRTWKQSRYRYFQLALENNTDITSNWNLKSTFGLSSKDIRETGGYISGTFPNDRNNLQNCGQVFSQWTYMARFMLNYEPKEGDLKAAIGYELNYDLIRPAWGTTANEGLWVGDGIISGPGSDAYAGGGLVYQHGKTSTSSGVYYPVGDGWETLTHSFIGELNYQLTPKTTMILSARIDKHSYTNYYTSPRIAFIHELKKDHYLKFIMQKSVRMNTADELYMAYQNNKVNKPETLETMELIYSAKMAEHWFLDTSVFFNRNEAIAWNFDAKSSSPVGTLKTIGTEIELKYKKENFELGINHSIVKQLSWKTADRLEYTGISYSDYYYVKSGVTVGSMGNDLANWANQSTKLYTNIDFLDKRLTFHGDIKAYWGFEGNEDGVNSLYRGLMNAGKSSSDPNVVSIQKIREEDAFGVLVSANLSLTYHVNKSADLSVFVQNIPIWGSNKRYMYSSGIKDVYTGDKVGWIEEPMVVGFKYKIRF